MKIHFFNNPRVNTIINSNICVLFLSQSGEPKPSNPKPSTTKP